MIQKLFLTCSALLMVSWLYGQQVVLNSRGERIVVYSDGSWRYYEAGDSVLAGKSLLKQDLYAEQGPEPIAADIYSVNPESDADVSAVAIRLSRQIDAEAAAAHERLKKAVSDKFAMEGQLDQARANRQLIEPDLFAALEESYEQQRLAVKEAQGQYQTLRKLQDRAGKILSMPLEKKPAALTRLMARYEAAMGYHPAVQVSPPTPANPDSAKTPPSSLQEQSVLREPVQPSAVPLMAEGGSSAAHPATRDYRRAPVPCHLQSPGNDPDDRHEIAVEKALLFSHTDEDLRPYFRQEDLVSCFASLRKIEDNVYLTLEFQVASPDARKNFGILEIKSLLRLKLINGSFISLFNTRTDLGRIDAYTGDTIYYGSYLLDREAQRALERNELDKVRVVWSSGFEDYDIIDIDFLINQFACLNSGLR